MAGEVVISEIITLRIKISATKDGSESISRELHRDWGVRKAA